MSVLVNEIYDFGPFRLDVGERALLRDAQPVALTPKAFETLVVLVQHSGHLVGKDEVLERVWHDTIVEESNLNVIIHTLRKALGDDRRESKYIETISKRGYRFVAAVKRVTGEESVRSDLVFLPDDSSVEISESPETRIPDPTAAVPAAGVRPTRRVLAVIGAGVLFTVLSTILFFTWRSNRQSAVPRPVAASASVRSIAVLPFRVLSTEKGDEYLSLGLADALITSLSQTRQVIVRGTEAVAKYQNASRDPLEAGREQGVEAVLDGQVQRIGDRVRVSARLVRTSDGTSLWADHFDEQFTNIFAVEDVIAERVARTTIRTLTGSVADGRLIKRYTENSQAYEAYLKGRYFWNKRTADSLHKALGYFQQAVRLDPNYALAYVGVADTYTLLSFFTLAAPNEAFPKAKEAAEKALAIDGTLAEAYTALGHVKSFYEWDWAGAEEEFQKGIALNPNYPLLHHWRSLNFMALGRLGEARAAMQRALELDPLLLIANVNLGRIDYYEGHYERAVDQYKRALDLDENFMRTHLRLGLAYVQQGRYEEALAEYHRARQIAGETPQINAHIAHALALSGKRTEALAALAELQERARRQYVPPYDIALVYIGLGDTEQAFAWLEKAYADHSTEMIYFKVEPMLAPLRQLPPYQNLLRRMGLPQ